MNKVDNSVEINIEYYRIIYLKYNSILAKIYWTRLVRWILWHINLCWFLNAKTIFMKIILFQTIPFSISMLLKCKYSLIVKNISISSYSV